MRTLVTGGAGFIGSHLCDALLARGDSVTCLDDLSSSTGANITHLLGDSRFQFIRHDIAQPWPDLPVASQVYHLACPASPVAYQRSPVRTMLTNVVGTHAALNYAARVGAPLLFTSTSEVYGDPEAHPQHESYTGNVNTTGPRSCYDEGKRAAETLCFDYRREGLDARVVRIFNTYGPRMDPNDGRVVVNFIQQALAGEPFTVYGDGSQTRSFCYVDDLVEGLLRAMSVGHLDAPVNLGNPQEVTVLQLAEAVAGALGRDCKVIHEPLPVDDPKRRRPDITRAAQVLGWRPSTPLRAGIQSVVKQEMSSVA